jgi:hypothetical protein
MQIVFLLGSGTSIPAGMPKMDEITERVLSGNDVRHHSDQAFYFSLSSPDLSNSSDEYVRTITEFLRIVREVIDECDPTFGRSATYEDLYFIVEQIYGQASKVSTNPAVVPLMHKIEKRIHPLLRHPEPALKQNWTLWELAEKSMQYIRCVVWHLLEPPTEKFSHLGLLTDACSDNKIQIVDIFTVNHDTVLEKLFTRYGVKYADGFSLEGNQLRSWNPSVYDSVTQRISLFKLHGSIDWFQFSTGVKAVDSPSAETLVSAMYPYPVLLVGTLNKPLVYSNDLFSELHCRFYYVLKMVSCLVVIGYGFSDQGVNLRVIPWIRQCERNRMIVIDPGIGNLKKKVWPRTLNDWAELEKQGKLVLMPKSVECITWRKVKHLLDC